MGFPPEGKEIFYRGEGCDRCFHTGYRGRIGVFEILNVTPAVRRAIYSGDHDRLEGAVAQSDFVPIMENCRQLLAEGVTTVDEVERVLGVEEGKAWF